MTSLAAVVLAHADPPQVRRLVAALEDVPVVLHCDAKTSAPVFDEMVRGLPSRVTPSPRVSTSLASWSLVAAELRALRVALETTSAEHIAVLSGSDYPLLPVDAIREELAAWEGQSWFFNQPMPFGPWGTPRNPDGGMWRLRHRFLTRHDQVQFVRGIPLRSPLRRDLPAGIEFRASSQWKVLARPHAELLLRIVDERPDLVRFWRTTLVPDETFVASVLASPSLAGEAALRPSRAHAWYIHWPEGVAQHPEWVREADFDRLADAARAPRVEPAAAWEPGDGELPGRKLFARKFRSADSRVLDRIDAELRAQPG